MPTVYQKNGKYLFSSRFCCDQGPIAKIKQEPPLLVERGTLAGSNCSFKSTESTILCMKKSPRVYETRCCPTHGAGLIAQRAGLPNPVKRISLPHSIRKSKKTQTSSPKPTSVMDQNTEIDAAIGTEEVMIKQPSIEEAFSSSPKVIHSFASSDGFEPKQENLLRESINMKTQEWTNEKSSCSLKSNVSPPVEKSRISESSKEGEKVSAEEIVLSKGGSLDTEKGDEELT
ncbi:uncharacterized protein LOC125500564 [Athalia rosae]|uniref:uncharacterized protein LOC125500564 n=1 Tax=Athalia rosae TaxID=37344 RepID=UPI0020332467|nr:uncharacterized protein LOC125500564 [Athalia rosae]XP_048509575.1 uncharacterized protein LOC125500564 [Athalia rosae]XP_048509576.1 uncharacterized protein LOC125500564 [Athalia rosae]